MTTIKKSGKKEEFSPEKLAFSIATASDEAQQPLTKSDVKRLVSEFQQIVNGKDLITTQQIDVVVSGLLYSKGYHGVLKSYTSYIKKK